MKCHPKDKKLRIRCVYRGKAVILCLKIVLLSPVE